MIILCANKGRLCGHQSCCSDKEILPAFLSLLTDLFEDNPGWVYPLWQMNIQSLPVSHLHGIVALFLDAFCCCQESLAEVNSQNLRNDRK